MVRWLALVLAVSIIDHIECVSNHEFVVLFWSKSNCLIACTTSAVFCVSPISDVNWWTVVPRDDEFEEIDASSLGGAYVFVEATDVVEAIAEFVAMYLVQVSARKV